MANEVRLHNLPTAGAHLVSPPEVPEERPTSGATLPLADRHASGGEDRLTDFLHLPVLPGPSATPDLEALMESLNFQGRREACRQGLAGIEVAAGQQKAANAEMVAKMQENLAKMDEAKKLQSLMKILGIFALVVSAVVTVATLGAAGPVVGAIALVLLANSVASQLSGGKYCIAGGISQLCRLCGADKDVADQIGMWMEVGLSVAALGAGIAVAFAKSSTTAADAAVNAAAKLAKGAAETAKGLEKGLEEAMEEGSRQLIKALNKYASQVANNAFKLSPGVHQAGAIAKEVARTGMTENFIFAGSLKNNLATVAKAVQFAGSSVSGATMGTQGYLAVKYGAAAADATHLQADARRLEALLVRLREYTEMERAMIKAEMERCNALMDSVIKIVHTGNDALTRVAATSHAIA